MIACKCDYFTIEVELQITCVLIGRLPEREPLAVLDR